MKHSHIKKVPRYKKPKQNKKLSEKPIEKPIEGVYAYSHSEPAQVQLATANNTPIEDAEDFRHCDDYIDDKSQPLCLRRFLRYSRWPAIYQFRAEGLGIKKPPLFADCGGERYRVVMASRFGDVGITKNLEAESGYSRRVVVADLSNFSAELDK